MGAVCICLIGVLIALVGAWFENTIIAWIALPFFLLNIALLFFMPKE